MSCIFGSCGRRGSGVNTLLFLGALSLAGSFYFSNNGDTKNAMFLCAGSAILFLVSWFVDRASLKGIIASNDHSSEMDAIYRELDKLNDSVRSCKTELARELNEEMDGVNRRIDSEVGSAYNYVNGEIDSVRKTVDIAKLKREILNEG